MAMNERSKEKGFTILELLLVLSIVSLLTIAIIPIGGKWIKTMSHEKALDMFITTVHSMQSYALANQVKTAVQVIQGDESSGAYYKAITNDNNEVSRTYFPKGIRSSPNAGNLKTIDFEANGDLRHPGTLRLLTDDKTYLLAVQFVKGRVIIHESDRPIVGRNDFDPSGTRRHFWYTFATRNEINDDFT